MCNNKRTKPIILLLLVFSLFFSACGTGTTKPVVDPVTGKPIDLATAFAKPTEVVAPTIEVATSIPSLTESPVRITDVLLSSEDDIRSYCEKNYSQFCANPDVLAGTNTTIDAQRTKWGTEVESGYASLLGITNEQFKSTPIRDLLSQIDAKLVEQNVEDPVIAFSGDMAFRYAQSYGDAFSEDYVVDGITLSFGYDSQFRQSYPPYKNLYDYYINNSNEQFEPIYKLLFGQQLNTIPYYAITANPSGYAKAVVYYPGDLSVDQKIALISPEKQLVSIVHLSFAQHSQPTDMTTTTEVHYKDHIVNTGSPMGVTMVYNYDNRLVGLPLTQDLLNKIIEKGFYISFEMNNSMIQDGVIYKDALLLSPSDFLELTQLSNATPVVTP